MEAETKCLECQDTGIRPIFGDCCAGVENGAVICGCYGRPVIVGEEVCDCEAGKAIPLADDAFYQEMANRHAEEEAARIDCGGGW
jgi:hypothetical protein